MSDPHTSRRRFWLFALPAALLILQAKASAEEFTAAQAVSLAGQPRLISDAGRVVLVEEARALSPGYMLQTGPGDRALIRFPGRPECRFILETDSAIEVLPPASPNEFKARLLGGNLRSRESSCGLSIEIRTPAARIRGRNSEFWLRASDRETTVGVESGGLRLLHRGQAIRLRTMTRTTISRSGIHRISTLVERKPSRRRTFSTASPPSSIRRGFSGGGISSVSAPGRP